MCGIGGFINFTNSSSFDNKDLITIGSRIQHRGPDDCGYFILDHDLTPSLSRESPSFHKSVKVGMVHRRLSIIDLSDSGWQPMGTSDLKYFIVFNGEIYNYKEIRIEIENRFRISFTSTSDTEVLLYFLIHYGPEKLDQLTGMFAFAFVDLVQRKLIFGRDPFGIKPLYYSLTEDSLLFASEIKSILSVSKETRANNSRIFDYLHYGRTDHGDETMFEGIIQVAPGSFVTYDVENNCINSKRYWTLDLDKKFEGSYDEAVKKVRETFLKNIELHLRSDVTVGTTLSGGIDSSSIVSAIRYLYEDREIHTFSYVAKDSNLNEESWIDRINSDLNCNSFKTAPDPKEFLDDIIQLINYQDEPFGSTSIYAQKKIFELVNRKKIKVILGGQGADDLFAGYRHLVDFRMYSLINGRNYSKFFNLLNTNFGNDIPAFTKNLILKLFAIQNKNFKKILRKWINTNSHKSLNNRWFLEQGIEFEDPKSFQSQFELIKKLRERIEEHGLPWLLRYEDRNSMLYSIESRVPFLTTDLAQLAISLPESYLISDDGVTKCVFREAMKGITPEYILNRKDKIGFETPEKFWLMQNNNWVVETILEMNEIPFVNIEELRKEWEAIKNGKKLYDRSFWRKLNLGLWSKQKEVRYN